LNFLPLLGVPFGARSTRQLLTPGDYWANGIVSGLPIIGAYPSTLLFTDGSPGDTITGEIASGASITGVKVLSSPISITSWDLTARWNGILTQTYMYFNGAIFVPMTNLSPGLTPHVTYTDGSIPATFSGVPLASIFLFNLTESDTSGGNMRCSDSRTA